MSRPARRTDLIAHYSTRSMPVALLARLRVLATTRSETLERTLVAALEVGIGYLETTARRKAAR